MSQDRLIWAEQCEERGVGGRRSLCVTNFPRRHQQWSHISDLLPRCAAPTVIPNNKEHPPVIIIIVVIIVILNMFTNSYLLPSSLRVSLKFHFEASSLHFIKFTVFWLQRFVLPCSSCLFLRVIFLEGFLFVSPNNISGGSLPFPAAAASLILDYSSNLCKLKPCQIQLKGLSVCHI